MTLATHDEAIEAEIVPTKMECLASIERAIDHANGFWAEILWQVQNRVWDQLNYSSFDELWEDRYAGLGVRISRHERPELVAALHSLGNNQTQIAKKLGVDQKTVSNDVRKIPNVPESRTDSLGRVQPTRKERKKEMPATLEHQSPFAVGHALVVPGNGKALAFVGEDGRAASNSETMRDALEWAREHPEQSRTDAADESGLSAGTLGNAYTALRNNHEIYRRNRLVERFDSIAQGLTYVADDLESLTADLERATAEDLEFGREYFEDAMKKLNAFRKQLNAKY